MQYTYTQTCTLQKIESETVTKLRSQLISVLCKNVSDSTSASVVLSGCVEWANAVRSLKGSAISYTDDDKVNFSKVNCFVPTAPSSAVTGTFICKRISGTSPEYLQFTLNNIAIATLGTVYSTALNEMAGTENAIDKYIIVNAIIDK